MKGRSPSPFVDYSVTLIVQNSNRLLLPAFALIHQFSASKARAFSPLQYESNVLKTSSGVLQSTLYVVPSLDIVYFIMSLLC